MSTVSSANVVSHQTHKGGLKDGIQSKVRVNLDWTRDPPPTNLTPFQKSIRDADWKTSPLGLMCSWPDQLRQMILLVVADPSPAVVFWGDHQAIVYNEAYAPLIGEKHPGLQGQDPRAGGFAEIWDQFDEILLEGERTGQVHIGDNQFILFHRYSYFEETYFTWKIIPMVGPQGYVVASHATVVEVTREFIGDRRAKLLHSLRQEVALAQDSMSLWSHLIAGLEAFDKDIPNVMIYADPNLNSQPSSPVTVYQLAGSLGVPIPHKNAPNIIMMDGNHVLAPAFCQAQSTFSPVILRCADGTLPADFFDGFDSRGFDVPSTELAVIPIVAVSKMVALVLFGLNPRKRYDSDYELFLQRISEQLIATKMSAICLVQEIERGALRAEQASLEKSQLARRLQEEMKFSKFAERVTIGLAITNPAGDVLYANKPWYDFSGLNPEAVGMTTWMDTIHPDDRHILNAAWRVLTIDQHPTTFQFRSRETYMWTPAQGGAAEPRHKSAKCFSYPDFNDDGVLVSVMGIVVDISELKSIEEQLRLQTSVLTDRMEEAIMLKERQESFIDMISHEIRNPLSAVLLCTEDIVDSLRLPNLDPSLLSIDESMEKTKSVSSNITDAAKTILYCVEHQKRIVDDVLTLSKLDSDLLELLPIPVEPVKMVSQVLGIFYRELKASYIRLTIENDDTMHNHGLDYVMLDPHRFLQIVINLITNAIKFTRNAQVRQIVLRISASKDDPSVTATDVEFFPAKSKPARHTEELTADKTVYISMSVADTGMGLSNDERKMLFQRFSQASPKTHIEYGGSGLGLFISRQITELMGGQIGVRPSQRVWCTFCFFVKTRRAYGRDFDSMLQDDEMPGPITLEHAATAPSIQLTPKDGNMAQLSQTPRLLPTDAALPLKNDQKQDYRVLVVEDNLVNQRVLCQGLRKRGFRVDTANHGEEALDALKNASQSEKYFDVVLCDIEMPVMDGIECVQEIRKLEARGVLCGHIPVVAVTANVRGEHARRAEDAGMDAFTTKPYRMDELIKQIRKFRPNLT